MKLIAFSVFDTKADTYSAPFFFPARGLAVRAFRATVEDKSSQMNRYPDDFKMVELGEFDDQTGAVTSRVPTTVCFATDFREADARDYGVGEVVPMEPGKERAS